MLSIFFVVFVSLFYEGCFEVRGFSEFFRRIYSLECESSYEYIVLFILRGYSYFVGDNCLIEIWVGRFFIS